MGTKKKRPSALQRFDFDGIANKFDKNIYGTSKGILRHQLLIRYLEPYINSEAKLNVLDVGAGTGMMAREFLSKGHNVHLVDSSCDVLDIARERLISFENCTISQSSIMELDAPESINTGNITDENTGVNTGAQTANNAQGKNQYDVIICHALLEWLPNPFDVVARLVNTHLKPNGVLSVSFFNYDAVVFNNVLYGNFDYVRAGCKTRNQVRLNPHNAQKPQDVLDYVSEQLECQLIHHAGLRCFHDYMLDKSKIDNEFDALLEMELTYGSQHPYKWLGKYCHMIFQKPV